jgi:hypothetical protein
MRAKLFIVAAGLSVLLPAASPSFGGEWFVDASVGQSGDGTSRATAFKRIQNGIDATANGDTVTVAPGTYLENISFYGKNIILRSTDPLDRAVTEKTIIDGGQKGVVVTFSGAEDETCILAGFTIRNGAQRHGGGINGNRSHPTIRNNIIAGNTAWSQGGGLYGCAGTIANNTIVGNSGWYGGGLYDCQGAILNNTISGNEGRPYGGGLSNCGGTIKNCIIWGNSATSGPQLYQSALPTYSCIQDWEGGGEGNMSVHPHFVHPRAHDYHLRSWSPCIDAGDPTSDFSNEPEPNGGRIDMGAYGNTLGATSASADTDADLLPDDWETHFFSDLALGPSDDPDGDGISNAEEYQQGTNPNNTWYVDAGVAVPGDGTAPQAATRTIQEAIDTALPGDTVRVLPGRYTENVFVRKSSSLIGSGTDDTTIDSEGGPCAVTFTCPRYEEVDPKNPPPPERYHLSIEGFTITNSTTDAVGPVYCSNARITLNNCKIIANSATFGACIFLDESSAIISGCELSGNSAAQGGGAIYSFASEVAINDCLISSNAAPEGGGIFSWYSHPEIVRTVLSKNTAQKGGGIFCEESPAVLVNCTVADNSASEGAGGIHCQETAPSQSLAVAMNSIIWGNGVAFSGRVRPEISFSDVEDTSFAGSDGNISAPPLFLDTAAGDYHLGSGSPCTDAGNPDLAYNDEDGSRCDMGAFGGTGAIGQLGEFPRMMHLTIETDSQGRQSVVLYWFGDPSGSFLLQSKDDLERPWPSGTTVESNETWLHRWVHQYATELWQRLFYRVGTTK